MFAHCPHIHVKQLRHQLLCQPNRSLLIAHFNTRSRLSGKDQELPGIMLNYRPRTGLSEALFSFTILRHTVFLNHTSIGVFHSQIITILQTVTSKSEPTVYTARFSPSPAIPKELFPIARWVPMANFPVKRKAIH